MLNFHIDSVLCELDTDRAYMEQHPRDMAWLLLRLVYGDINDPDYWGAVAPWCLRWRGYVSADVEYLVLYGLRSFIDTATREQLVQELDTQIGAARDDVVIGQLRKVQMLMELKPPSPASGMHSVPAEVMKILAPVFLNDGSITANQDYVLAPWKFAEGYAQAIQTIVAAAFTPMHLR